MKVIFSQTEQDENDAGYWSDEFGWTELDEADLYDPEELDRFRLPMSAGSDAKWMDHTDALIQHRRSRTAP